MPVVGFFGGLLDAIGGGGWGPIVTSTLIGGGHTPRFVIGSVNITEFFVTVATSAAFALSLGLMDILPVIPFILGGLIVAPFAGYLTRVVPTRLLMAIVGLSGSGAQPALAVQAGRLAVGRVRRSLRGLPRAPRPPRNPANGTGTTSGAS